MKRKDLDADADIFDFGRGLSDDQRTVFRPIDAISATQIRKACEAFWHESGPTMPADMVIEDVPIYEHSQFPGLRFLPGLLPPEAQVLFVSRILHRDLANPLHTTNLTSTTTLPSSPTSIFTYPPSYPVPSDDDKKKASDTPPATTPPSSSSPPPPPPPPPPTLTSTLRKLRYLTLGTQYHWPTRTYPLDTPTPFPSDISALVTGLFPNLVAPQSGVCLLYRAERDLMPVHRDVSENCARPLASFSFGCDGLFLIARGGGGGDDDDDDDAETAGERERERRDRLVVILRVRSGDCVYLDGEARWSWHAMPRTVAGTVERHQALRDWPAGSGRSSEEDRAYEKWKGWFGGKRLNVSCRQVWD